MVTQTSTSTFPIYQAVRSCTDCYLRQSCLGPVPGIGSINSRILFVGEAPGEHEDEDGIPFTGAAGIMLDDLLSYLNLLRSEVYITNCVRCRPRNNATPSLADTRYCADKWLQLEIDIIRPQIIVAMGQPAIRYLLGDDTLTVEHTHSIPQWRYVGNSAEEEYGAPPTLIFPTYHPAAGLYTTPQLRMVFDDFRVLKEILNGADPLSFVPTDLYPNPDYIEVTSTEHALALLSQPEFSLDTETVPGPDGGSKLWSVQVSMEPGTAWFIPAHLIPDPQTAIPDTSLVTVHNYLYDAQFIRIPRFIDTMVAAYLLGLPQGLKELAFRLCGMEMYSYDDYVHQYRQGKALDYLQAAECELWAEPDPITETKWDNKSGSILTHDRKPNHISRKIWKILDDVETKPETDAYRRWHDINSAERTEVESVIGLMLDASLEQVPYSDTIYYSSRDADATIRVRDELLHMIDEAGLGFVLNAIDLPTLPIINEMMDVGMPIDPPHLNQLSAEFTDRLNTSAADCAILGGYGSFNPNSPVQVADLVYGSSKLNHPITKRSESGLPSTDDRELKKIRNSTTNEVIPLVQEILNYRQILKAKTSYADVLPRVAVMDSAGIPRVRCQIRATRGATGRLTTSDPVNLQAMPVRSEDGRRIRDGFCAPPGYLFLAPDYCLAEGTGVDTPLGEVPIELLEPGDPIYSVDRDNRPMISEVKAKVYSGERACIRVQLSNGEQFTCTPNHRVPLNTGVLKHASELSPGNRLMPLRRSYAGNGYTTLYTGSYFNYTYEHREVARWAYGPLPVGYSTQHKDGDKHNNSPDNLEYLPNFEHMSIDGRESYARQDHTLRLERLRIALSKRRSYVGENNPNFGKRKGPMLVCFCCEADFYASPSKKAKFCSIGCSDQARKNGLNHKVVSVEAIGSLPVWDIEIDNASSLFALTCGVYTHNSQIEMRLMAHASASQRLIQLFWEDLDIHTYTASILFGIPYEEAKQTRYRYPTKRMNFSIIYGITPLGLYEGLIEEGIDGWSLDDCARLLVEYDQRFPEIKQFLQHHINFAKRTGYVQDMVGRRRYMPELFCPIRRIRSDGERAAGNMPIQSGAQAIIKLATNRLFQLRDTGQLPWFRFLLQVHDELILEVECDYIEVLGQMIKPVMESVMQLSVPLKVELKSGERWGSLT